MKNQNCKIFLLKGDRNLATSFYLDVLELSLRRVFSSVAYVDQVTAIGKDDVVVVITVYSMLKVIRHRFRQPLIYWFQGVLPEELAFNVPHLTTRQRIRQKYMAFWEWFVLHRAKLNIFVSESMLLHYRRKYRYGGTNYFIMPCYNQPLMKEAFFLPGKYETPSFAYAGGMLKWQCVEEMVQLYNRVKERFPQATLTLLTNGREDAEAIVRKYEAKDVTIKFVPVDRLNDEQAKYKYGLLLRADSVVNHVSTPTKFNSYLAVGMIPVVSRVIGAYDPIISDMNFVVSNANEKDFDAAFDRIVALEESKIDPNAVYKEYERIFERYYNTERYISELSDSVEEHV